ncbi:MAG: LPD1 domain-containing protein [Halopseudomonas sabulinigri]
MIELPSVWGRHTEAFIDPVMVNGRALVTSIMNSPAGWEERMSLLGFRQGSKAWLRVGYLTPAEFQYLSPSIDLVGLRDEDVIDLIEPSHSEVAVPYAVQDAILRIWQRQSGAMLIALSMEHSVNYSRSEAWSFVETALSGTNTPESETILGLALTKLNLEDSLNSDLLVYARHVGWNTVGENEAYTVPTGTEQVMFRAGVTVNWADEHGVVHAGRLAQRLKSKDTGAWVHKEHPHWAGGYPVVSPIWISRQALQYPGTHEDWSVQEDADNANLRSRPLETPAQFSLTEGQQKTLRELCNHRYFPSDGWEEVVKQTSNDVDFNALKELADHIEHLSAHYYGSLPIQFIVSHVVDDQIYFGHQVGTCPVQNLTSLSGFRSGFSLTDIASTLDSIIQLSVKVLESQSAEVGRVLGVGPAITVKLLQRNLPLWQELFANGLRIENTNDLLRVVAASTNRTDMIRSLDTSWSAVQKLPSALNQEVKLSPRNGIEGVNILAGAYDCSAVELDSLVSMVANGTFSYDMASGAHTHSVEVFTVEAHNPGTGLISADFNKGVSVFPTPSGEVPIRHLHSTMEQVKETYKAVVEQLLKVADEPSSARLKSAELILENLPLRSRFLDAITSVKQKTDDELFSYLNQSLSTGFKGGLSDFSEGFQKRIIDHAIEKIRKHKAEGVVFVRKGRRMFIDAVELSDESLIQSRDATLEGKAAELKASYGGRCKSAAIDLISMVDPEICDVLSGTSNLAGGGVSKPTSKGDGYQDTGVVAGFALKDIRGMGREALLLRSDEMSDLQKSKYITKDLIWPRKSMEELKEKGHSVTVASAFDMFWKGLPKAPLSPARTHVFAFIELLTAMRETVDPILESLANTRLDNKEALAEFSRAMTPATKEIFESFSGLRAMYPMSSRKIRGTDTYWSSYQPNRGGRFTWALHDLSWSEVIKPRKKAAAASGSRVQRGEVVRLGPDYRQGIDVSSDDFINTFMYSGVEYGNWTNQKERAKHLNFAYDSMMDFTRIMGWEPPALSLGGRLGLCIGSRGHGGSRAALAHFEPANMAVNLTRMRGDGSLAHEYFHAVACHYGRLATGRISDVLDTIGYDLRKAGSPRDLASISTGLRDEVRDGFYKLLVSIMHKPHEGSDPTDIRNYTHASDMLVASLEMDKGSKVYWSQPAEMFARAMEIWVRETLAESGERNDYLVGPSKDGTIYPSSDHLGRINHFVSPWLESMKTQVQSIEHPFLGPVDIPVLYSKLYSAQPANRQDLVELCESELVKLFGSMAPHYQIDGGQGYAGLYRAGANIIRLSSLNADKGTFYHESWHACHNILLTRQEKHDMNNLFAKGGDVSEKVRAVMVEQGWPQHVIEDAAASPEEMAAFAFQLWSCNLISIGDLQPKEFQRVKGFVDGVVEVGDLFHADDAVSIFEKFASGELAARSTMLIAKELSESDSWDEDNRIFWSAGIDAHADEEGIQKRGLSLEMRL